MLEREKIIFHPISLDDRDWVNGKLGEDRPNTCEYTFANNFVWAGVYGVQVGKVNDCGVIRYKKDKDYMYSFPFGNGDKRAAIELLRGICGAHDHGLSLYPVDDEDRLKLIEWFPGEFEITPDRGDFDYVYTVEKLSELKGKKLHGKRNHIARFMDDGDWHYEAMSDENIPECRRMAKEWIAMREEKWNDEMEQEIGVLEVAFANFDALGLKGGVLYKDGKIVAFTIGERLNDDTFVVHFEKAFPDLQGAYPMINQQFVLHEAQDFIYVNREEDTGDPGLRKAKMSYHPDMLVRKYCAKESRVVFASEFDREAVIDIWRRCFGDELPYIEMYMDNRFENENMFVIHEDGRPVSMASMLPVQVTVNGAKENARYVYAVATLPEYRKRGYASEIIRHAAGKYGEPLILQPSDRELRHYYGKFGFADAFCESPCWLYNGGCAKRMPVPCAELVSTSLPHSGKNCEYSIKAAESADAPWEAVTLGKWSVIGTDEAIGAKEYKAVRDAYFEGEGYVEWDEKALSYAMAENKYCCGKTLMLSRETPGGPAKRAVLMYRVDGCRLLVMETTLVDGELQGILPGLLEMTGTSSASAGNMGGMVLLPGRLKDWSCREGYLGLTMA